MKEYNVYFDASYLVFHQLRVDVLETTFDSETKMVFFITDICLEELYKNILKPLLPKVEVELFLKTIHKISNTLQLPDYRNHIEERSKQRIDAFIKDNQIQIVDTTACLDVEDYKRIIELAQNEKAPFKTKPREFKDAKSLFAILKHSKTTKIKPTLLSEDKDWKDFENENKQNFSAKEFLASEISKAQLLETEQKAVIDLAKCFLSEKPKILKLIEKEVEFTCSDYFLWQNAEEIIEKAVDRDVSFDFPSARVDVAEPIYNFRVEESFINGEIVIAFDFSLSVNFSFNDLETASWDEKRLVFAYPKIGEADFRGKGEWKIPLGSIQNNEFSFLELMDLNPPEIHDVDLIDWGAETDPSFLHSIVSIQELLTTSR